MSRLQRFPGVLAALAVAGAVFLGGCGEEDAVNEAQDEIERQAEDLTQGIPDDARDVQQQVDDATDQVQDQIDDITDEAAGTQP